MKSFLKDFKEFAIKGNMLAMAVGILIGASFSDLITSLTDNIISPILSIFISSDFNYLYFEINEAKITYGAFLTSLINFIIMALIIFSLVRIAARISKKDLMKE